MIASNLHLGIICAKERLTTVRTGFDYRIDARHGLNLNYLMNRTGNERYDEIDTDFDPSNDIFTKHILGLSYNQRLVNDRWQNSLFVKNYTNYLNVTQQDLPWITNSREKQDASTKNYTGYGLATRYGFGEGLSLKASYEHSMRLRSLKSPNSVAVARFPMPSFVRKITSPPTATTTARLREQPTKLEPVRSSCLLTLP